MGLFLKRRKILLGKDAIGERVEIWVSRPNGADRFVSCDMSDSGLVDRICTKYGYENGFPLKVKQVGDMYLSDDEKDAVTVESLREFNSYYKKAEKQAEVINGAYKSVKDYAPKLLKRLKAEGILVPFSDEVRIGNTGLSIRFLGGFRSWSGDDEDLCDATVLSSSIKNKVKRVAKEFENECGMKISFSTGEKAWSYFTFYPKV